MATGRRPLLARLLSCLFALVTHCGCCGYQGRTPVVCGEVNAKNGFGGHTGYQKYIASGETFGPYLEETTPAGEFAKAWNELCV